MEPITLDAIDQHLLDLLQTDAAQSNQALAAQVHVSPPTCLRRVQRLRDAGLIERQVAILQPDRLAALQGHGLACIVEVSLDRQGASSAGASRRGQTLCWCCTRTTCRATCSSRSGCSRAMPTCATSGPSLPRGGQNLIQKCL